MKTVFFTLVAAVAVTFQAQAITLEEAQLPAGLSNTDILELVEGFSADENLDNLSRLTLGVAHQREDILIDVFQKIAEIYPDSAADIVYTISQNLPDAGLGSFVMMSSYLSDYGKNEALAALNQTNTNLLAQLSGQGLAVETAAGPAEESNINFDAVLESIDVPMEK